MPIVVVAPEGFVAAYYDAEELQPPHTPAEWERLAVPPGTLGLLESNRRPDGRLPDPRLVPEEAVAAWRAAVSRASPPAAADRTPKPWTP